MVKNSIRLFIFGLLMWPMFMMIVGWVSPYWAIYVLDDPENSQVLLELFKFVPLAGAIVFSLALLLLTWKDNRVWLKRVSWGLSAIFSICACAVFVPAEQQVAIHVLNSIAELVGVLMFIVSALALLKVLPATTKAKAVPEVQAEAQTV